MRRTGALAHGRGYSEGREAVRLATLATLVLACVGAPIGLSAQVSIHAQAIPLVTRASQMPEGGKTLTEFAVVQPTLVAEWRGGPFLARATLNGEGLTIDDGELAPGNFGEGYFDRRHPHTYVHELVVAGRDLLGRHDGGLILSVAGGPKGFVAFGTDDPMSRPVVRYPVNHHYAQILERAVVTGSVGYGPVTLELTWFNGDEPTQPTDWPNWDRGLDSRAIRGTVAPVAGLELQLSYAEVKSPEHRGGAGPTQQKWDASARWSGMIGARESYALVEWARTEDAGGFFVYPSKLVEGGVAFGRHRPYFRVEVTERPEEMRSSDPFHSQRPHTDDNIIGITKWSVVTAGYGVSFLTAGGRLELRPFVEGSLAGVEKLEGVLDPEFWYGGDVLPSLTLGVRMDWGGMNRMRMGRYLDAGSPTAHEGH